MYVSVIVLFRHNGVIKAWSYRNDNIIIFHLFFVLEVVGGIRKKQEAGDPTESERDSDPPSAPRRRRCMLNSKLVDIQSWRCCFAVDVIIICINPPSPCCGSSLSSKCASSLIFFSQTKKTKVCCTSVAKISFNKIIVNYKQQQWVSAWEVK